MFPQVHGMAQTLMGTDHEVKLTVMTALTLHSKDAHTSWYLGLHQPAATGTKMQPSVDQLGADVCAGCLKGRASVR